MATPKLRNFLDEQHVPYTTMGHSETFTAQETAEVAHIRGQNLAKTVMVKIDGQLAMAVLPATDKVDFFRLQEITDSVICTLAREDDFADVFPDCEVGAMPPFGNLWDMDVYVASDFVGKDEIVFNAGSHLELMKMSFTDYEKLVHPHIETFSRR